MGIGKLLVIPNEMLKGKLAMEGGVSLHVSWKPGLAPAGLCNRLKYRLNLYSL